MGLRVRTIATIAGAFCLAPALLLQAAEPAQAPDASGAADTVTPHGVYSKPMYGRPPRVELFLGYSYFRGVPTLSSGNRMVGLNGGSASVALNLDRYLGLVAEFSGYNDTQLRMTTGTSGTAVVADASGNALTYLFGPRLSYRSDHRLTPFAQVLLGGVHASAVTLSGCTGTGCTPLPAQDAFALTAGGGLDLRVHRHVALRLIQAEYFMTRFADPATGGGDTQNDLRLSAGLLLRLDGGKPAPPVTYACAAAPASVYPGESVTVTGTAMNLKSNHDVTYSWTADGGKIAGSSATANIDTSGIPPGAYVARGHLRGQKRLDGLADCSAAYTVLAWQPPAVSCIADRASIREGDEVAITAQGISPQNRPLTYSYAASQGTISGNTSRARLITASAAAPGTITVTCNVADDMGQTSSATTTVAMETPLPVAAPTTEKLCTIDFGRDARHPTRVDNEGKACLDQAALSLEHSPDATIAVVGYGFSNEGTHPSTGGLMEAAQRATNVKDYLARDKGIDPSRIALYTGSGHNKMAETILIPSGATLNTEGISRAR